MTRTRSILIGLPLTCAAVVGSLALFGPAGSAEACGGTASAAATSTAESSAALGAGAAATSEDEVVIVDSTGERRTFPHSGTPAGVLRHARSSAGLGTVYVNDVAGRDIVTAIRTDGTAEHSISGEAAHPTFTSSGEVVWAQDFASLRAWSPSTGAVRTIARPQGTVAVFSPLSTGPGQLLAVAREPVAGESQEDDGLNNLYRYDEARSSWTRLTAFTATGDRWSVVRTPIVDRDGSVLFIRVQGVASATEAPTFELWRLRAGVASKVRDLRGEMYLAGTTDSGLLWNVVRDGEWRLLLEDAEGTRELGCGGAQVDPRSEPDPDLMEDDGTGTAAGDAGPALADAQMGLLVGDFVTEAEAQAVATLIGQGFRVVSRADAPFAVPPNMYAVARNFEQDEDMEEALASFRSQFPQYAELSYVVSLVGGGTGEE